MRLRLVQFNTVNDIHDLLELLHTKRLLRFREYKQGIISIKADLDQLAKCLLMASDGNTYFIDNLALLRHDESITNVNFLTKKNISVNVHTMKKYQIKHSDFIFNRPLAATLMSIEYSNDNLYDLNMKWPQTTLRVIFPVIYPVTTDRENTYDRYEINDWLAYRSNKHLPLTHPKPNHKRLTNALSHTDIFTNVALQQLIRVNVQLIAEKKLRLLLSLHHNKPMSNKYSANATVKALHKTSTSYKLGLLHKKINAKDIQLANLHQQLAALLNPFQDILIANPTLANKSVNELEEMRKHLEQQRESITIKNGNIPFKYGVIILCFSIGFLLFILSLSISLILSTFNKLSDKEEMLISLILGIMLIISGAVVVSIFNSQRHQLNHILSVIDQLLSYTISLEALTNQIQSTEAIHREIEQDIHLLTKMDDQIKLHISNLRPCAQLGAWDAVLCLIESGVDVNKNNVDGNVLASAAKAHRWDVVTALIQYGMKANKKNIKSFQTALAIALDARNKEMIDYLSKHSERHTETSLNINEQQSIQGASSRLFKANVCYNDPNLIDRETLTNQFVCS